MGLFCGRTERFSLIGFFFLWDYFVGVFLVEALSCALIERKRAALIVLKDSLVQVFFVCGTISLSLSLSVD